MRLLALTLVLVTALAGCATATVGQNFDATKVRGLTPGVTTLADATTLLGRAPNASATLADGTTHYTWSFVQSKATAGLFSTEIQTATKAVTLQFSGDGVLRRTVLISGVLPTVPVSPAPTSLQTPAPNPPVASRAGKDLHQAERFARDAGCGSRSNAALVGSGPGFETYTLTCTGGDVMVLRCEMGNCRAMK